MNCKPGDLAIVIGATQTPEMIGLIVEVVRATFKGEVLSHGYPVSSDVPAWVIRRAGGGKLPMRLTRGVFMMADERGYPDRFLRPIPKLPETETTEEQLKEPA